MINALVAHRVPAHAIIHVVARAVVIVNTALVVRTLVTPRA